MEPLARSGAFTMSQRPTTFGQLLRRLMPPAPAASQARGPFIASATELPEATASDDRRSWVILHSVTNTELRLIHPRPIASREIVVHFPAASGEILRIVLTMAGSEQRGELYETTARFLRSAAMPSTTSP